MKKILALATLLLGVSANAQIPIEPVGKALQVYFTIGSIVCYLPSKPCDLKYTIMDKINEDARSYVRGSEATPLLRVYVEATKLRSVPTNNMSFDQMVSVIIDNYKAVIALGKTMKAVPVDKTREASLRDFLNQQRKDFNYDQEDDVFLLSRIPTLRQFTKTK